MRQIKFRGKTEKGEWVYGYLVVLEGGGTFIFTGKIDVQADWIDIEIIPSTVGQFTGVCDVNGKEIYEGDKVYLEQWYPHEYIVTFDRGGFCFYHKKEDDYYHDIKYLEQGKIVGTIHDEVKP